tara:strand:+ start:902 stop:1762 length:861 start_codon:yes stop_codon:yes gene_type:complete
MKKALFVGNGVNRLSSSSASWEQLLNQLAGPTLTDHEHEVRKNKPFTLLFEELESRSPSSELKETVAVAFSKSLSSNAFHRDLMQLGYDEILTTNYDYCLEEATDYSWQSKNSAPETVHSLFRRRASAEANIWHIHGEAGSANTIMLGHSHYAGYLQKIRSYITAGVSTESKKRGKRPYVSKYTKSKYVHDTDSWVDVFLEFHLDIVGFGMDYTENHIWNLLTEKRKLAKRGLSVGTTTYHRCSDEKQNTSDEARLSLLESFGVKIQDHTKATYEESYHACIDSLG